MKCEKVLTVCDGDRKFVKKWDCPECGNEWKRFKCDKCGYTFTEGGCCHGQSE